MQVLFPDRRHRADAPSAADSGALRQVPRGETALTARVVEGIERGRARSTLSADARHSEQAELMAGVATRIARDPGLSAS
jgi:hypothetical protein